VLERLGGKPITNTLQRPSKEGGQESGRREEGEEGGRQERAGSWVAAGVLKESLPR